MLHLGKESYILGNNIFNISTSYRGGKSENCFWCKVDSLRFVQIYRCLWGSYSISKYIYIISFQM